MANIPVVPVVPVVPVAAPAINPIANPGAVPAGGVSTTGAARVRCCDCISCPGQQPGGICHHKGAAAALQPVLARVDVPILPHVSVTECESPDSLKHKMNTVLENIATYRQAADTNKKCAANEEQKGFALFKQEKDLLAKQKEINDQIKKLQDELAKVSNDYDMLHLSRLQCEETCDTLEQLAVSQTASADALKTGPLLQIQKKIGDLSAKNLARSSRFEQKYASQEPPKN